MSGPRLAHYELEAKIGEGGMGVVYRARDTRLDRPVAIKILPRRVHRDPQWRARFLREARAAARLNHPNLATIYEIDETEAPPALFGDTEPLGESGAVPVLYIAMEFVEGEDLQARLARGPLKESEVVDLGLQITRGLEAAHRAGIVHRDLKPHNLRITPEGTVKVLDFGLAKMLEAALQPAEDEETLLTAEGMVLGTAPYMSPEQVAGEAVDARSDLFSLGVVLYEMAGGRVPYEGGSLVRYVRNLTRTEAEPLSKVRPGISPELEAIVGHLLEKDVDERYVSASAVREDLEALVQGSAVSAVGRRSRAFRVLRGRKGMLWGLVAGLASALMGLLVWQGLRPPPVASVAVLPMENQTSNPELDAYYEGIGTALIRKLARIPGVNVVPELDVRRYRDTEKTAEEIARELDVGTLVQGYVQGGGEEIRIGVQMLSAASSIPLWDQTFEGHPDDLLTLQEQIADGVLRFLPVSLSQRERQRLRKNPTESREAWDAYFRGLSFLEQVDDRNALERAAEYFERAVEADPGFAWAHAGLSETLWRLYRVRKEPELLDLAEGRIERAVELMPGQPELWVTQAQVLREERRYEGAVEALERGLALNPDLAQIHLELAIVEELRQRGEAAEQHYRRASALRPSYWIPWNERGSMFLEKGRFEEAREAFHRAQELAPHGVIWPAENLAVLEAMVGNFDEALARYEDIPVDLRTPSLYYNMGAIHTFQGSLEAASAAFQKAVEQQPEQPVYRLALADTLEKTGHLEAAREQYEKTLEHVERQRQTQPGQRRLQTLRSYLLARLGSCSQAVRLGREVDFTSTSLEDLVYVARAFVVCGETPSASQLVRELLDRGMTAERLRGESELRPYVSAEQ